MHIDNYILNPRKIFLAALLVAACIATKAQAWQVEWELDQEMGVLEGPVWRPIIIPYGDGLRRGAPQWTYYRQQPKGAQDDFRQLSPSGAGTPLGGATPGISGGGSIGNGSVGDVGGEIADGGSVMGPGGAGGGSSGTGNDGQGPQITPPDIGGPDIPMDPLPLPPPITPPF
jgi:hypothetical protein